MTRKQYRVINRKRFYSVAVGYGEKEAQRRAEKERRVGHNARVIKAYPGEWRVWVDYNLYRLK